MQYHRATSLDEALRLLRSPRAVAVAGGTALMAEGIPPEAELLVDVSALPLRDVREEDGGLTLGGLVTLEALRTAPQVIAFADGVLAEAARLTATSVLRHRGTLAGALLTGLARGDLPAALLALEAEVAVCSQEGEEMRPLEAFYAAWDGRPLRSLIAHVRVPALPAGARARLVRVARTPRDQAILTVTAVGVVAEGRLEGVRVAAAGVGQRPVRLRQVEAALRGEAAEPDAVQQAAAAALEGLPLPDDTLASAAYRRAVLPVLVRRAVVGR